MGLDFGAAAHRSRHAGHDLFEALDWVAPPYLVFNSACESGRAAGGARLVSDQGQANGLAAAFLACGAAAAAVRDKTSRSLM